MYETNLILQMCFNYTRVSDPAIGRQLLLEAIKSNDRFPDTIGKYASETQLQEAFQTSPYEIPALVKAAFQSAARARGKKIAGDKSPHDIYFIHYLLGLGIFNDPDVKVIHLVRDIRSVCASIQKVGWVLGPSPLSTARHWETTNRQAHRSLAGKPDKYCLMKYEDLVRDPRQSLKRCTDFLGVDYSAEMLNPNPPSGALLYDLLKMDIHKSLARPINAEHLDSWKDTIRDQELFDIEEAACPTMLELGYDVSFTRLRPRNLEFALKG